MAAGAVAAASVLALGASAGASLLGRTSPSGVAAPGAAAAAGAPAPLHLHAGDTGAHLAGTPAGVATPGGTGPTGGTQLVTAHVAGAPGRDASSASSAHGTSRAAGAAVRLASVPSGWVVTPHPVAVGGLARSYLTVEPATLASASPASVPVVVLMHGLTMTPAGVLGISDLAGQIGPAVLVVPAGWHRSWDAGGCCGAAYRLGVNDVGFVRRALTDVLAATPAADRQRVYVAGFSNGGRMAYRLACDLPGVFAGMAAVEAVPVAGCVNLHPLDITVVAQQADPLLTVDAGALPKYVDGHVEPTVGATVDRWRTLDGCGPSAAVTTRGQAVIQTWTCAAGTHMTYVWYPGGAHRWRPATATTPGVTGFVLRMMGRSPSGA